RWPGHAQLHVLVRRPGRPVVAPGRARLAQRAVRDRLRRPRWRRRAGPRRPRRAGRALGGVAAAACRVPPARPAARTARAIARDARPAAPLSAGRPVRRGRGRRMSAAPDIAAVVVSYRSASTLDACLHRLRIAEGVAQIRVVDNASDDATLEIARQHALADPRVRFIANPDNPGFAVACNQGAADSDAPWLAFVNPDLQVERDSLWRLRAHAIAHGGPCLLGADLYGEDGVHDGAARRRDPDFAAMLRDP